VAPTAGLLAALDRDGRRHGVDTAHLAEAAAAAVAAAAAEK
jgi:hypothetical protein